MNERIRELAEQAQGPRPRIHGEWTLTNAELKMFAELIVEEMYDFIMDEGASDNGIPDLGKIKQHFGVEQ